MITHCPICQEQLILEIGSAHVLRCTSTHSFTDNSHFSWVLSNHEHGISQINLWDVNSNLHAHYYPNHKKINLSMQTPFAFNYCQFDFDMEFLSVEEFYNWFLIQKENLVFQ